MKRIRVQERMNGMKGLKRKGYRLMAAVWITFAAATTTFAAQSAGWIFDQENGWQYQMEDGSLAEGWQTINGQWYYFNENGFMETGWIYDEGNKNWYFLNEETGVWETRPAIDREGACHLLENALVKADLYQNEEEPLQFKVEYETSDMVKVVVGTEKEPGRFYPINTYEISRKTGIAEAVVGDDLSLY